MGHSAKKGRATSAALTAGLSVLFAAGTLNAAWTDNITLKGDFRYRFEYIGEQFNVNDSTVADTLQTRYRHRIRGRLGVEAKIFDDLKAYVGLSTGDADPASTNQTLTSGFTHKPVMLDLAYFEYKPSFVPGLWATGGKIKKPWTMSSDLVWDSDLNPEGMALGYNAAFGAFNPFADASALWVMENSKDKNDIYLYSGQLGTRVSFAPGYGIMLGGSYYTYTNISGARVIDYSGSQSGFGNSTWDKDTTAAGKDIRYAYGYNLMEGFGEIGINTTGLLSVTLYGDFVMNTAADSLNTGCLAGVRVGKASAPGTFEIDANYRLLEKDAVLGAFTDSDQRGGGTDGSGFKVSAKYQFKYFQPAITWFHDVKGLGTGATNGLAYDRLQADINFKF